MATRAALVAALLALFVAPATAQKLGWVPDPRRANGGWVSDPAHHLKRATVDSINALLTRLESETSNEIAVVVIDSLDGLEPADAALLLHRKWGVGKQARDNGLVLLWSPALRKLFVSVGQGLEGVIPDARAGRIQDEEILPAFRANDFDRGILQGTTALAAAAREETDWRDTRLGFTPGRTGVASQDDDGGPQKIIMLAMAAVFALVVFGSRIARWRRNRPRKCPNGHGPMRRLSEQDDDAALEEGERVEESVKSVDYDVWVCPFCDARIKVPYRRYGWYSECSQCKRQTVETLTRTLRAATQLSEGLKRVKRRCQNCGWSSVTEEVIPRLPLLSSSSGSSGGRGGGSSFGGGSSGGGGAGRSY